MNVWSPEDMTRKSTPEQIRARFDADVERFSNLETGQSAAIDSPLHLELIAAAAVGVTPRPRRLLDLGCGPGNYTLKLLMAYAKAEAEDGAGGGSNGSDAPGRAGLSVEAVTLVDLSRPMLDRARQRVAEAFPTLRIETVQADVRGFDFGVDRFDLVVAGQCLHHLRDEPEWDAVFAGVFGSLRRGGSFWIADSLEYHHPAVRELIRRRWAAYLTQFKDADYARHVMEYVDVEDSPRPLAWQLQKLRAVGFVDLDVLHVHGRFGSFGGVRP